MIRGLSRCLQYRSGLSERFVRNHWSNPSSSQTTTTATAKPAEESQDIDFKTSFQKLLPSDKFRSKFSESETERLEHVIKQVELYCYMARKVPTRMSDEDWQEVLDQRSVFERVCKLEFFAVRQRRQERDEMTKEGRFKEWLAEQNAIYQAGGMGYGPEMYELVSNPMRRKQRVNHEDGSRVWSSLRLNDSPTIIMDMQYIFDGKHKGEFNIKRQLQYVITENFHASRPLPLLFSNVVDNEHGKGYMEKSLGYWSGEYTNQTILPDVEAASPREAYIKTTGKKNPNIVYISKFAKKVLDGPLRADAYVMCASYDMKRESIIAAHKDKIEAYRLPIQKYVKWEQGPQVIAFPNMMRIFRELLATGGDWQSAFYNNIAKRYIEAKSEEELAIRTSNRRNLEREKHDIVGAILDSYGEHP